MLNSLKAKDPDLILEHEDQFRRCGCGKLVRVSDLTGHVGHFMRTAYHFTFWEYLKIKLRWL